MQFTPSHTACIGVGRGCGEEQTSRNVSSVRTWSRHFRRPSTKAVRFDAKRFKWYGSTLLREVFPRATGHLPHQTMVKRVRRIDDAWNRTSARSL
jgi:hypothetical protein